MGISSLSSSPTLPTIASMEALLESAQKWQGILQELPRMLGVVSIAAGVALAVMGYIAFSWLQAGVGLFLAVMGGISLWLDKKARVAGVLEPQIFQLGEALQKEQKRVAAISSHAADQIEQEILPALKEENADLKKRIDDLETQVQKREKALQIAKNLVEQLEKVPVEERKRAELIQGQIGEALGQTLQELQSVRGLSETLMSQIQECQDSIIAPKAGENPWKSLFSKISSFILQLEQEVSTNQALIDRMMKDLQLLSTRVKNCEAQRAAKNLSNQP